jgi:hypothetical protein
METVTIGTKTDLVEHEAAIARLFSESFGSPLPVELWRWAYLTNPHGDPYVSLCYDNGVLVGHYAMIPLPVSSLEGRLNSYLSMTTMVSPSHRMHGLFTVLAEKTYEAGKSAGVDLVMGFPNAMSAPGFKKRLGWDLPPTDYVAALPKQELIAAARAEPLHTPEAFRLDLTNARTREWRLSRPGAKYQWNAGLAYKEYGHDIDLLAYNSPDQLDALPDGRKINLLLPDSIAALKSFKAFDYQFGGRGLASRFESDRILRQMALSDVF